MFLACLDIYHVRNLEELHIECNPGLNCIYGENAAGKTAILEAIHLLAQVKSFRTPRTTEVIQHEKETLSVAASLFVEGKQQVKAGLEKSAIKTRVRFNGEDVISRSKQSLNLPVMVVIPDSQRLIYGAPRERRHWLDLAMFHVEPDYIGHWRDYHNSLRQRNALLRNGVGGKQCDIWEENMAGAAEALSLSRKEYLDSLEARHREAGGRVFEQLRLALEQGPLDQAGYMARWRGERAGDIRAGHTRSGPHREDVHIITNGNEAGKTLSRGESKRLLLELLILQAIEYYNKKGDRPILLIDDFPSELDRTTAREAFLALCQTNAQVFITATEKEAFQAETGECGWFHVKHGRMLK